MRLFGILLLFVLSGCATAAGYRRHMDAWKGDSSTHLVEKLGVPTKTVDLPDGGKAYEYGDPDSRSDDNSCHTTFFLDPKGVIKNVTWRGFCIAKER